MGHVGVEGLHLPVGHGQPLQQGVELCDQRPQLLRLPAVVQAPLQVLGRQLARLLGQLSQRRQAQAHQPDAGQRHQQGAAHGGQGQRPGQQGQLPVVFGPVQRELGTGLLAGVGQHDLEAALQRAAGILGRAQAFVEHAALQVGDAQRHLVQAREKVVQHVGQPGFVVGAAAFGHQVQHGLLLEVQRLVLVLLQRHRCHPVDGRAHQAQAQHGLQGQPARQAPAQVGNVGRGNAHGARDSST